MGTNYYLYEKGACPTCGHTKEPLHIGKSSAGWCFSLHIVPEDGISTLQDWMTRWSEPEAVIQDEYGDNIAPDEMIKTITDRGRESTWEQKPYGYASWDAFHAANQSQEGPNGLLRHRIDGRHCLGHGEGSYDFMGGEFS